MLSSIRNFALSFVISLLIFGVSAYFLVGFIENNMNNVLKLEEEETPLTTEEEDVGETVPEEKSDGLPTRLTFLICGIDDGASQWKGEPETDVIILFQIDKIKKEFIFTTVPCNMKVDYKGYTLRLGQVYTAYDMRSLIECIKSYTGLDVDFYAVVDYLALKEVFEVIGEIEYNVSMDMYYMPLWVTEYLGALEENKEELDKQKKKEINRAIHRYAEEKDLSEDEVTPEIDLKKGMQKLDAEKALQLLRYKDYSNGDLGRVATALDFCKEILRQKVTFENYGKAPQIFKALKDAITTNMTEGDLMDHLEVLFSYSKYTTVELIYPGELKYQNGNMFFFPSINKAFAQYAPYRK